MFSAVLAGCAGGGGFGGTADAGNSPNSVAAPVEVAGRPISDQERRKVAEAVSQLNFRGAADVAPENVGVSRSAAILNVNPFAAAESAEAPTRAEPRKMEGYKAFEVAVPAGNPIMTVAVWISETPPEDGELPEKPGKKLLYLRLQVFFSVGNNIPLLEGHNVVELESEVIVVEERRPTPLPVEEPETDPVIVTPVDDCLGGSGFCGAGRTIIIQATPDDGMCVSGWTGACAGVGEAGCVGAADERKKCVLVVTPDLDLDAINPVYAPRPTILATVVDVPVTTAPPLPSTVAATLECAGGTLPAEGRTQDELDFEFLTAASRHFGWTSDICDWLRRGANVNAKSKPGWDKRGDWRVVEGKSGHTALHLPYLLPHYDSVGIMNLLVEHGAEINARNSAGETPLHMMIRRAPPAHPRNASHFLGFEPDVRAKTNNGQTPLHYAAQWGGVEIVKMLVARGAEPDLSAQDDDGHTPLALAENHYAELDDSPSAAPHVLHLREYLGKVIAFLRDRTGVYPEDFFAGPLCPAGTLPANGMTQAELNLTLQAAAVAADTAGICEALRRGAESDARYSGNRTPLALVAASRHSPDATADAAKLLLANGADPDVHDDTYRWTALHWAIRRSSELMTALLAGGANADVLDKYDWTPLHWAVRVRGEIGATRARLLLDGGADVNMRGDDPGLSPLDYADQKGSTVVAAVLRDAGGLCFVRTGGLCDAPVVISEDVVTICPAGTLPANGMSQAELNLTLQAAAVAADTAGICEALRRGAESDARYSGNRTPLALVAASRHSPDATADAAKLLLANGADPDVHDDTYRWTALHWAIRRSSELMTALLAGGANADVLDKYDWTPLHWAVRVRGEIGATRARLLLDGGADVNMRGDDPGLSPLDYADQRGSTVVAAVLRDAGGLCFVRTGGLCDAPVVISEDVVTIAATVSATVAATVIATVAEDVATVFATVVATVVADDGSSCPAGSLPANGLAQIRWNTTLMFSAMLRRLQPACDALRRGAYINVRDTEGRRPLYWAANHGDDAMVSLLIENGADVDVTKNDGVAPLHAAAKRNAFGVVKLLIDGEANVNLKDSTGKTPLHWSALRKAGLLSGSDGVEAARLLIDGGADVNATDNDGGTPLHTAAGSYSSGYVLVNPLALVRLLLANGVDATVTNNNGETALDIARRLGNSDMVAILAPDENPSAPASAEEDALADALRKDFAASFNPSPAFGDAFGAVSGSSERFLTRLNSLMRATSGTGGDAWDSFSGWRTENEHGRFWFSTGQRGDFGFGAGGNGAGGDFSASPFAALVGNGMLAGGETGLGADGKLRIAAFADYQAKSLLDGEDKRWTQWAARGTAIETAMTEAERFSGLSKNRTRGAMTEIHLGGGDLGVALQAGAVSESDSVLSGTAGNDDLRGLRSRTAFAGLSGAADLFDSGWRLRGSAHLGRSWAESEGMLRDSDLWASAFSAGLERGGWLYSDDGFVLRFAQPLRVERWDMELIGDGGARRLGANASGRQLDVDAAYRLPLSGGGWLLLSAGVRRDGGHSSSSDLEAGALFSVERGF